MKIEGYEIVEYEDQNGGPVPSETLRVLVRSAIEGARSGLPRASAGTGNRLAIATAEPDGTVGVMVCEPLYSLVVRPRGH